MAKASAKAPAKKSAKPAAKTKTKKPTALSIEKVCSDALEKLQALGIEQQLQADLEWCLGSYRNDKNPSGLYEMAERALSVYKSQKEKKTKGITAKTILDVEQVLADRT
ncbi:MAG TPA: hypothetical protein VGK59_08735 [Ohtaekwangia sp.]